MATQQHQAAMKVLEGGYQWRVQNADYRQDDFTKHFFAARKIFKEYGVEFAEQDPAERLHRIEMSSHFGPITIDFVKVMEADGELAVAVVFTDLPEWRGGIDRRVLFTAILGDRGNWAGTDGEALHTFRGQFVPATALDAVRRALAAKLALDTAALTPAGQASAS